MKINHIEDNKRKMLKINYGSLENNGIDYEKRNQTRFPHDITIQDCRDAIKGVPGFRETNKNGMICFNYDFSTRQSFPDPLTAEDARSSFLYKVRRECRGIIFEQSTGALVCRKFHKFFNINELDETHQDKINLEGEKYIILEKLDGSLIAPIYSSKENKVTWGSKAGATDLSAKVDKYIASQADTIKYGEFSELWLKKGYTPMYEWCSESQRIVLYYAQDLLSLTAIRSIKTGEYILYDEMVESAKQFNVPVTGAIEQHKVFGGGARTAAELLEQVQKMRDIEGYILRFDDGRVFKMKCACTIHSMKKTSTNCRKDINNDKSIQPWFKKLLFQFIDEIDCEEDPASYMSAVSKYIIYILKNQCGSASKLDEGRKVLGGLKFVEQF
ncbi:hypothetical protein PPL_05697 [Heterostelium album PN500]|uniref:T4 RNA ligase 1-like N-terminal domain-containing protein n=1 Tax=Heterostelium pallidum (strain ATCC 26659 / Pp 5 / PN500) TaxID=670386 RepID=D3BAW6_HETP5|nr:hypothetical protein PPL_05697 [Heterostelium album PN500]EFA81703.1 hypothetical protein PPL_05697 [Heterostelium album PN500]|eukprot:XP_020433820.1 hypothetical protein PPL_05697 [Heterostelium album PN500]